MAIDIPPEEDVRHFLTNGGQIRAELDAIDIDHTMKFESAAFLHDLLDAGFELEPSKTVMAVDQDTLLIHFGGDWQKFAGCVYRRGGQIRYRRIREGRYEAVATIPSAEDD